MSWLYDGVAPWLLLLCLVVTAAYLGYATGRDSLQPDVSRLQGQVDVLQEVCR
jgi:hypothetical protein